MDDEKYDFFFFYFLFKYIYILTLHSFSLVLTLSRGEEFEQMALRFHGRKSIYRHCTSSKPVRDKRN